MRILLAVCNECSAFHLFRNVRGFGVQMTAVGPKFALSLGMLMALMGAGLSAMVTK
jgi:hypothetical protein